MSSANRNDGANGIWESWLEQIARERFLCKVPTDFARKKVNFEDLDMQVDLGLYGKVHASYLSTDSGTRDMQWKYERGDFGKCPRVFCEGQHVLPVGPSAGFGKPAVQQFCPRCCQRYKTPSHYSKLDGAMFGSDFPDVFFMHLPHLRPLPPTRAYTPRLFGMRVHPSAL